MIKGIATGIGLQAMNNYTNWPSFYNNSASNNNTLVGQVRYSGSSQNLEVYDGMTWLSMPAAHPTVELSSEVQSILNWAKAKMVEEARLNELARQHSSLADALTELKRAEEQVRIVAALVNT